MDYKELIERLKCPRVRECPYDYIKSCKECQKELYGDATAAITDLLSRADAAEARVRELEKLLSAVQNMENFHPDETGFFVFTKKDADDITGKLLAAEARCKRLDEARENANEACAKWEYRAEKAEKERDAAVNDLKEEVMGKIWACDYCKKNDPEDFQCKRDDLCGCSEWEWNGGQKEE